MNPIEVLTAGGLTIWLVALVGIAYVVQKRVRFPKSLFTRGAGVPLATQVIGALAGVVIWAYYAFTTPNVVLVVDIFLSGFIPYVLAAYAVSVTLERRRARQLGLPEPGTGGTLSFAEGPVFLAIAFPFAAVALFLIGYGIWNETSGNRGEGLAGLGLGAVASFIAIAMGLFGFGVLWVRRVRDRGPGN
jgi:hypothetical protein